MKTTVNGKEIKVFGRNDISVIFTQKVNEMLSQGFVFCFDGDNAGQKAAVRAAVLVLPFLRDNSDVRFAFVTGGKDPDEILRKPDGKAIMNKIIDNAMPLVDFLWQIANSDFVITISVLCSYL